VQPFVINRIFLEISLSYIAFVTGTGKPVNICPLKIYDPIRGLRREL
jgi:hypothetical protein